MCKYRPMSIHLFSRLIPWLCINSFVHLFCILGSFSNTKAKEWKHSISLHTLRGVSFFQKNTVLLTKSPKSRAKILTVWVDNADIVKNNDGVGVPLHCAIWSYDLIKQTRLNVHIPVQLLKQTRRKVIVHHLLLPLQMALPIGELLPRWP